MIGHSLRRGLCRATSLSEGGKVACGRTDERCSPLQSMSLRGAAERWRRGNLLVGFTDTAHLTKHRTGRSPQPLQGFAMTYGTGNPSPTRSTPLGSPFGGAGTP